MTTYDCLIIGGGPAGLAVALGLARQVRTAVVFDSKTYRNSKVDHMHNVLTWDHRDPAEFRAAARKELTEGRYKTIKIADTKVTKIHKTDAGQFEATDGEGKVWHGRKLVLATGVKDIYPDIPGYKENWPESIYHCLFCHGFEEAGADSVGVLARDSMLRDPAKAEHVTRFAHNLARTVTIYTDGDEGLTSKLQSSFGKDEWATIDSRPVARLHKTNGVPVEVELKDGTKKTEGFLVHAMDLVPQLEFEHNLDLELAPSGTEYKTATPFGETTCKGVFLAGDVGSPMKAASMAIGPGAIAAVGVITALVYDAKAT